MPIFTPLPGVVFPAGLPFYLRNSKNGIVFSRNGNIFRGNSTLSLRASQIFKEILEKWGTLSPSIRDKWNLYVSSSFAPHIPKSNFSYTGQLYFLSCYFCKYFYYEFSNGTIRKLSTSDFFLSLPWWSKGIDIPGSFPFRAFLDSWTTYKFCLFSLKDCSWSGSSSDLINFTISMNLAGSPPSSMNNWHFSDPYTLRFYGLTLYCSAPLLPGSVSCEFPLSKLIGIWTHRAESESDYALPTSPDLNFYGNVAKSYDPKLKPYHSGDRVYYTLFGVDDLGQSYKVGSVFSNIT